MKYNRLLIFLILSFSIILYTPNTLDAQFGRALKKLKKIDTPKLRIKKLPSKVQGKKNGAQLLKNAKKNPKSKGASPSRRGDIAKKQPGPSKAPANKLTKNKSHLDNSAIPIITQKNIDHIKKRHWYNSTVKNTGKFDKVMTDDKLKEIINITVDKGHHYPGTLGRSHKTVYEYDLGRYIGLNSKKQPTTCLRVILDPDSTTASALPI